MTSEIRWPLAVYFDASILRQLPMDLSSPDLVRLRETAQKFEIPFFVPGIAKEEWLVFHEEAASKEFEKVASSARTIGKYLDRPLTVENLSREDLVRLVRESQVRRLEAAGFIEIPTIDVDQKALVAMAVRRVKPFKEGDKGFRDTLITMSIATHAKQFSGHAILVVAADKVFSELEVLQGWERVGVRPLVAKSLEVAIQQLEGAMDEAWKAHLNAEEARIRVFLLTRQEEIFTRLKDAEVSEGFVRGIFTPEPAFIGTLQRIRQVRPVEITRVSRGHVGGTLAQEGDRIPITFDVKVAFDIIVNTYRSPELSGPRFRLGEAVDLPVGMQMIFPSSVEQDMTVERDLTIEAWVIEREDHQYHDLVFEKVWTW